MKKQTKNKVLEQNQGQDLTRKEFLENLKDNPEAYVYSNIFLENLEELIKENTELLKQNKKILKKQKQKKNATNLGRVVGSVTGLSAGYWAYNNFSDFLSSFGSSFAEGIYAIKTTDEFRPAKDYVKDYTHLLPEDLANEYLRYTDISVLENLVRESLSTLNPIAGERMQRLQKTASEAPGSQNSWIQNLIGLRQKIRNTSKAPFISKEKQEQNEIKDTLEYNENYHELTEISSSIFNKIREIDLNLEELGLRMKIYETQKGELSSNLVSDYKSLVKERIKLCDSIQQIRRFKDNSENIQEIYMGKDNESYSSLVSSTEDLGKKFDSKIYGDSAAFLGSFFVGYLAYKLTKNTVSNTKKFYDFAKNHLVKDTNSKD